MIITLLTDFGTGDHYAGAMKGAILSAAPDVTVLDITHDIPPQDIGRAAFLLHIAWPAFPEGTVHAAVVDPGVGSSRRVIAAAAGKQLFLAPDNGVLSYIFNSFPDAAVRSVENRELFHPEISSVFHGRDIFAPVAAFLATGGALEDTGPAADDTVRIPVPVPVLKGGVIKGEVIYVDGFGNCITNIHRSLLAGRVPAAAEAAGERFSCSGSTYSDTVPGGPVVLIGSHGHVEVAVRNGNAASLFGLEAGSDVRLYLEDI